MARGDHVQCAACGRSQHRLADGVTIVPGGALRYRCRGCGFQWLDRSAAERAAAFVLDRRQRPAPVSVGVVAGV
jgi:transposase-like protein